MFVMNCFQKTFTAGTVNPLQNNKIFDDKINVTKKLKSVLGRVENMVGKCCLPAFSLFPTMFSKGFRV